MEEEKSSSLDQANHSPGYNNQYGGSEKPKAPLMRRFLDSFKPDPNVHAVPKTTIESGGKSYDVETAAAATAESPLARKLKGRHLQMIAIGGSIGSSIPVSTAVAKRKEFAILMRLKVPVSSSVPAVLLKRVVQLRC